MQLAQGNIFANDPAVAEKEIKSILAVTPADVKRVYDKYLKNKNYVATSFVPKGKVDLALDGSKKAEVVEEKIVTGADAEVDPSAQAKYERTPSSFDRTKEPPYGPAPVVKIPALWEDKLANGLRVYGIQNTEVPLVQFEIVIDGGQLLDDINKVGVANMVARMMTQGTARKTPQELEETIDQLGSAINVFASTEDVRISVSTLARNYDATLALVEEILFEPRWDTKEFDLLKQSIKSQIQQQRGNPNAIATLQFNKLLYGESNMRSRSILGTATTVDAITLDDLRAFYAKNISPSVARMHVVGALDKSKIVGSLNRLGTRWAAKRVDIPTYKLPEPPAKAQVYFYDVPNAAQSVLRIGSPALPALSADYYPATVANYILGGGGFASQLTQQLREAKGYTYGIGSNFAGSRDSGTFSIQSGVRANVTLESTQLIKSILENYGKNYSDKDLETTKSFLIKSNARAFETAGAKMGMLENISKYGWKPDYVKGREQIVKDMSVARIRELSTKYLDPDRMIWLVVGDAKTQLPRLKDLGFGDPVLLAK